MPIDTKQKRLARCSATHYKLRCLLKADHEGNCFYFTGRMEGYFLMGTGFHWAPKHLWPKDLINIPWDVSDEDNWSYPTAGRDSF